MISHVSYNKRGLKIAVFILFAFSITFFSNAQNRLAAYENYINEYSGIAVDHMNKYGIPASIILSQGLLESGAGRSELTRKSNNHFGIKCHKDWTGKRAYSDDDLMNECFRKYQKAKHSYEDHAKFLSERQRYQSLFTLSTTDYKGWARGLQRLGYATDPSYSKKLITLIDTYELYQFDKGGKRVSRNSGNSVAKSNSKEKSKKISRNMDVNHGMVYVVSKKGSTLTSIAEEYGIDMKSLKKYNDLYDGFDVLPGDVVYLQEKRSRASKPFYEHEVASGESVYSISQLYGVTIKSLLKMNKQTLDYVPQVGDVLRLR